MCEGYLVKVGGEVVGCVIFGMISFIFGYLIVLVLVNLDVVVVDVFEVEVCGKDYLVSCIEIFFYKF